jgi:malate dehydrogenase (oxaloacetate-decarboxylating)(NADP+)
VAAAYGLEDLVFGPEYLIPKPFDPRLIVELPSAVAAAATATGVATRPLADPAAYRQRLQQRVFRSGLIMRPLFELARRDPQRLVYADGEEERVLRAVQSVVEEGLARPILVGRPDVVATRIERLGLRLREGEDFELVNPNSDPRYNEYVALYLERMARRGVTPQAAREIVRTRRTVIAAVMLARGEADAMLAGPVGRFSANLRHVVDVLGLRPECREASTVHLLVLERGALFVADTSVSEDPSPEQVCETALQAAETVRRFGLEPKVALLSHSNFGSRDTRSAEKMRAALALIRAAAPGLEVDGEMQADTALDPAVRARIFPGARLAGEANLLVMPTLDAASIGYNLVKAVTGAIPVGPILQGPRLPAHIVNQAVTSRGILNMSAVACVEAATLGAADADGA